MLYILSTIFNHPFLEPRNDEDYRWAILRQRIPVWFFHVVNFTFIGTRIPPCPLNLPKFPPLRKLSSKTLSSSYLVFPHEVPLYNSLPLLAPPTTFSQPSLSSILLASSLPIINSGLSRTSSLAARSTRTNGLVQTLPGPLKMPSVAL